MRLRSKIGTFAAAAALTLTVAACGENGDAADDPALRLASSGDVLTEEPFKIEMTMGDLMTATGAVDPATGVTEMTMDMGEAAMGMQMRIMASETDMWMDMGELNEMFGAEPGWMHLDLSRLGPEALMGVESGGADPANAVEMLKSVGEVEQIDDNTFEGVIDLTEAAPGTFDDETIEMMGEDATRVSFTATLDDQDRLSTMVFTLPDMGVPGMPNTMETRYFDYGVPVEITEPAADEVTPMPDMLYDMFEQGLG